VTAAELSGAETEEARRLFALLRAAVRTQASEETRQRLSELGDRLLDAVSEQPVDRKPHWAGELTPREIDVLTFAALGTKNREIAELLGVSAETVKSYLRNAMLKLGARSRRAAVDRARLVGAIP
jgi:LuxR family transcriptional regulator, regulator of acetate metabolism